MSRALELVDHVEGILETVVNGGGLYDISRQVLPLSDKASRSKPEILLSLNGMSSVEQDRSGLLLQYQVSVAIVYPAITEAEKEAALTLVELVVDTLESPTYRTFTTTPNSLRFCYQTPFNLSPVFDPSVLNEQGTLVSVSLFNYVLLKDR